jgi:hypothetical protein
MGANVGRRHIATTQALRRLVDQVLERHKLFVAQRQPHAIEGDVNTAVRAAVHTPVRLIAEWAAGMSSLMQLPHPRHVTPVS